MARDTTTMAAAAAVVTVTALPAFLTGALAVQMRADLGFDEAGLGLMVATFFLAASLASAPCGRLAERLGPAASMRVSSVMASASLAAVALFGQSLGVLLVCLAIGGLSNATAHPASSLFLARTIEPSRLGLAFGVKQSSVPAANLVAGLAVPAFALTVGWRWAFVAGAACAATLVALPPAGNGGRPAPGVRTQSGARETALRPMLLLATGAAFAGAAVGSLGSFLVSSAVDSGIHEGHAGLLTAVGSALGIAVRVTLGVRADRWDRDHLLVVAGMMAAGASGYFLVATQSVLPVVVGALVTYSLGWGWNGLFNLAVVRSNPSAPGAATGITQTGVFVGAVFGPLIFGFIVDRASYTAAWLVAGGLSLAAAASVAFARRLLALDHVRRSDAGAVAAVP